ncbi:specifically androgen-regulated gene protein [Pempheris klunzingeri]|uniref:specifically androgen-regulated gene protein n=1 Tax=Pempheris klunzingeri TaxID=3127111 RepID=UPI00398053F8
MPKSGTWPGGVAMESLSNMDSAGSCDSVVSMNSGYSEDSMEHLSAEEKACLMYLEETIEALEVQEDSGLSNDEPDPLLQAVKLGQMSVNDISRFKPESRGDQKSFLTSGVPTPLAHLPEEPGFRGLTTGVKAEQHALNQTSEQRSCPASAANTKDLQTPVDLKTQPKPLVTESVAGCKINQSTPQAEVLCSSKDGDGNLKIVTTSGLCPSESAKAPEIDLGLIPPPSDFMDEPSLPPQSDAEISASAEMSNNKPGAAVDMEELRHKASTKRTSVSSPVTQEPPNMPAELSALVVSSGPPMSPPPEAAEPRSPPAVAPKPKKLPANIILKSHKAAVADGSSGHSVPTSSDRLLLDPQRVRMEALRKLGLLKSEEADSGPVLSPKLSPQTRRSWVAPPSPISPASPCTPPSTPSYTRVSSPPHTFVPPQSPAAVSPSASSTAPADQPPDILPAPAAFSDPGPQLSDNELSALREVTGATVDAQVNGPHFTPPALVKQLTPPKVVGVKSATLERSGLGLSSYMASQGSSEANQGGGGKQSPSELRNNRPRPASLGSGKEFSSPQRESPQTGQAAQHSADSQKLPRSQGISVLICPRAENGGGRREALRRLGLLRD